MNIEHGEQHASRSFPYLNAQHLRRITMCSPRPSRSLLVQLACVQSFYATRAAGLGPFQLNSVMHVESCPSSHGRHVGQPLKRQELIIQMREFGKIHFTPLPLQSTSVSVGAVKKQPKPRPSKTATGWATEAIKVKKNYQENDQYDHITCEGGRKEAFNSTKIQN